MNTKYMFIYFLVILVVIGVIYSLNQKKPTNPFDNSPISLPSGEPPPQPTTPPTQAPVSITKLLIEDTQVGTGTPAASGNTITVNYTGMFTDGKVFDSSIGKQPFTVVIGAGQVISGWDQGILGMKVGGTRRLLIPADLAYGQKGVAGVIPTNSPLIFDIQLLEIK